MSFRFRLRAHCGKFLIDKAHGLLFSLARQESHLGVKAAKFEYAEVSISGAFLGVGASINPIRVIWAGLESHRIDAFVVE